MRKRNSLFNTLPILMTTLVAVLFLTVCAPATYAQRYDRLDRLGDYIEKNVPDAKFDYRQFGTTSNPDDPEYLGCLAGHGTKIFRAEGLTLTNGQGIDYQGYEGFHSLSRFFEISIEDSRELFGSTVCSQFNTDRMFAVGHLRKFIKSKRYADRQRRFAGALAAAF